MADAKAFWPDCFTAKGVAPGDAVAGLSRAERLPIEDLLAGQQRQLRSLLRVAIKQVPWYDRGDWARPVLADRDRRPDLFWETWRRIPPLSKVALREGPAELEARSVPAARWAGGTTSSSSPRCPPSHAGRQGNSKNSWPWSSDRPGVAGQVRHTYIQLLTVSKHRLNLSRCWRRAPTPSPSWSS
ncbi:MAG: hypothetical protein FJ197_04685 [Gammaproteobacteria bacterium]|nr:hypothetical protein [Gammaproteobacteria bacterium]